MRRGRRGSETIDHSDNTVAHMRDVKIQQITKFEATELQIAEELTTMDWKDRLYRLQLDDHLVADEKVDAVTVIDGQILIADWDQHLPAHRYALLFQFVSKAGLISALKQPRSHG